MRTFEFADVIARVRPGQVDYVEFLRVPSLSVGVYRLPAGAADEQKPHTEDEIYYVVNGQARFRSGSEDAAVKPGTVLFVEAGVEHRFHSIAEDLEVLVVFAPAEGTHAVAGKP